MNAGMPPPAVRAKFRREFSRVLEKEEVKIILAVWRSARKGKPYHASLLGIHGSLLRRKWLLIDADHSYRLSEETKKILADVERAE